MNSKRMMGCLLALMLVAAVGFAAEYQGKGQEKKDNAMIGWVTDSQCGAKGDSAGHADCAKRCVGRGAKAVLYTPSDKKVYTLEPQDKVKEFVGKHVKVTGKVEGDTLTIESIEATGEQKGQ